MSSKHIDTIPQDDVQSSIVDRFEDRLSATMGFATKQMLHNLYNLEGYESARAFRRILVDGPGYSTQVADARAIFGEHVHIVACDFTVGGPEKMSPHPVNNVSTFQGCAESAGRRFTNSKHQVLSVFTVQDTPDPVESVNQLYRVLAQDGTAAITVWGEHFGPGDIHIRSCQRLSPDYKYAQLSELEAKHKRAMQDAGFRHIKIETISLPFECGSSEQFVEDWLSSKHPIPKKLIEHSISQGVEPTELRRTMAHLIEEEYPGGQGVLCTAVVGWGIK